MNRLISIFIFLSFILIGCATVQIDESEFSKIDLIGTWEVNGVKSPTYGQTTYNTDGTWESRVGIYLNGKFTECIAHGNWKLIGNEIHWNTTKVSNPAFPMPEDIDIILTYDGETYSAKSKKLRKVYKYNRK